MKKFIFTMIVMLTMAIATVSAQTAVETSKVLDNVYVSVAGGVATPLTFNSVFPVNSTATVTVGKQFTPVWGAEVEGTAWFGDKTNGRECFAANEVGTHNIFRGLYVGVNGTTNITNLIAGYNGVPRLFEVSTVLGAGWVHTFTPNISNKTDNYFGVKTGLDFAFNLGETKAHTVSIRPAVLWNVTNGDNVGEGYFVGHGMPLQFDKRKAQLQLAVAYTYHFKTSNGTRYFKTYNVGALMDEINVLRAENEALKNTPAKMVEIIKEVPVIKSTTVSDKTVVTFVKNSAELTDAAKASLDNIPANVTVSVIGSTSPEGTTARNSVLSVERAKAVADYLKARGVTVKAVTGNEAGRIAIVTVE